MNPKKDDEIKMLLSTINKLKSEIFGAHLEEKETSILYKDLDNQEHLLVEKMRLFSENQCTDTIYRWNDVKSALSSHEYAIEFISYVGFSNDDTETKELKYGALILLPNIEAPIFVELCTFKELHNIILNALIEQEIGINNLYKKNSPLYNLLWRKIEPYMINAKTIYYSPILDLQSINMGFILCPNGIYLNEKYNLQCVSSTANVCKRDCSLEIVDATILGGVEYEKTIGEKDNKPSFRSLILEERTDSTRGGWGNLPASSQEVDSVNIILQQNGCDTKIYKKSEANESNFRKLDGLSTSVVHIATHAFYLVGFDKYTDYFNQLTPYSCKDESMLFSGLLLAKANTTLNSINGENVMNDGVITSEEISLLDLTQTQLVVLAACETALGVTNEGLGGLLKAFKLAGVKHIMASLWKVPDESTAMLMSCFYKFLMSGEGLHSALLKAQRETAKRYPDPYYWASFIIID